MKISARNGEQLLHKLLWHTAIMETSWFWLIQRQKLKIKILESHETWLYLQIMLTLKITCLFHPIDDFFKFINGFVNIPQAYSALEKLNFCLTWKCNQIQLQTKWNNFF